MLICDKTENEYIEQMRAAGLTVDVRDDITPEELPNVLPAYDGMVVRSRNRKRVPAVALWGLRRYINGSKFP